MNNYCLLPLLLFFPFKKSSKNKEIENKYAACINVLLNFPGWIFHFHKVHSNDASFFLSVLFLLYFLGEFELKRPPWCWVALTGQRCGTCSQHPHGSWRKYSVDIQKAIGMKESCNFPCLFALQTFGKVFLYCSLISQITIIYHPLRKMTGKTVRSISPGFANYLPNIHSCTQYTGQLGWITVSY